jgi:hypothetical protein
MDHSCPPVTTRAALACYTAHQEPTKNNPEANMLARWMAESRLLGFDGGDWSLLFGGLLLAGLLMVLA